MNHPNEHEVVLEVEGIVKQFPGVLANDDVSLKLHRGEILALLGENGAGKSTLMNIIYGLYHPDQGTIRLKGQEVHFTSPREAIRSGIGMVHQHFQLVKVMTVAENVVLGEEEDVSYQGKANSMLGWILHWLPSILVFLFSVVVGISLWKWSYAVGGVVVGLLGAVAVAILPIARMLWGIAWRVGLALAAIWIAGRIELLTEVAITDVALRQKVEVVKQVEQEQPDGSTIEVDAVGHERIDFDWRKEAREADSAGTGTKGVLASAQTRMEEYRDHGIPGWMIDAIDDAPPVAKALSIVLLLLVFGRHSITTWRGIYVAPKRLEEYDLAAVIGVGLVYVVVGWLGQGDVDTPARVGSVGIIAAGLSLMIWLMVRARARHAPDVQARPVSPLDDSLDSLLDALYNVSQISNVGEATRRVRSLSQQYGLEVDPDAVIEKLPVGTQQRVEIVKALYRKADILILDEPTAVLTPQESKELFKIMRELAAQGVSIIFITHKLKEVFEVATHIVVMRDGRVVGAATPAEATEASLAAMMVGREVILQVEKDEARPGEVVLEVHNLNAYNDRGAKALNDVSFNVSAGEVLGIAGVQGNGQTELVEVLTGLRDSTGGSVQLLGHELQPEVQPDGGLWPRVAAFVFDMALVAILAYALGSFVSYFSEGTFHGASTVTQILTGLLIVLIVDGLYFLGSWRVASGTLGMSFFQLQITDAHDKKPPFRVLATRYLIFLALRLPLGIPALLSFLQARQDPAHHAWFDTRLGLRVIHHERITPRRIKDYGTSHVPEDRQRHGLVQLYSVADNLVLNSYYERPFAKEPAPSELPLALLRYGIVFGLIVAALTLIGLKLWNDTLWGALLDAYDVPQEFRSFDVSTSLSNEQASALQWPFIISVISLLIAEMVFGVIAHFGTSALLNQSGAREVYRRINQGLRSLYGRVTGRRTVSLEEQSGLLRDDEAIAQHAETLVDQYDIRTPSIETNGGNLSGGNQQKMIVAREFSRKPRLLIAAQPTRGIDVGSIEFVHKQIIDQRDENAAVLLVSAELDEIMALSDRIAVMYKGEIIDTVPIQQATREQLGLLMAGIKASQSAVGA